ncbi:general negative regulator of transcription subunit 5 [Basidiobolus ranarum]|uniref:General negative regulator of transcription subunit n=1 Tax=Basidiobolus ranarum TaxID=34480 RepID=A0ABR2W1P9_9FUNG
MSRKLQAEIDRVLKKVTEGVESFEEVHEKIQSTSNNNQKEKLEQDLKKEIKKLQRQRDQIKSWISSNEIKDKRVLIENRKLIEQQMEKFKACEKEMKTKAYSKEGLSQSARLDPQERKKMEACQWVISTVDQLGEKIERLGAEEEILEAAMKKGKKDSNKMERLGQVGYIVERNKYHINRLELILRLLENGRIEAEKVEDIQETMNYYLEAHEESDFEEDEYVYEDLNLEEEEELYQIGNEEPLSSHGSVYEDSRSQKESEREDRRSAKEDEVSMSSPSPNSSTIKGIVSNARKITVSTSKDNTPDNTAPTTPISPVTSSDKPSVASILVKSINPKIPATPPLTHPSYSSAVSIHPSPTTSTISNEPKSEELTSPKDGRLGLSEDTGKMRTESMRETSEIQQPKTIDIPGLNNQSDRLASNVRDIQVDMAQIFPSENQLLSRDEEPKSTTQAAPTNPIGLDEPQQSSVNSDTSQEENQLPEVDNHIPPVLIDLVPSLDSIKDKVEGGNYPEDQDMLEASFMCMPDNMDLEKPKFYTPKSPVSTPSYYPQTVMPVLNNPAFYERFDLDTLFFIFYYQQGTYQQYLAARELKKQSWRFHKKYLTWFQRHEEPKTITEDYEQGTYIYFDYEGAWCQRKKTEFRLEYRYLEDAELL